MSNPAYFETKKDEHLDTNLPFYSACTGYSSSGYEIPPHWHNHIELLYFPYGCSRLSAGGRTRIVPPHSLVIINAREIHSIKIPEGEEACHYVLGFDQEFIQTAASSMMELRYLLPFVVSWFECERTFSGPEVHDSAVPHLFKEICREYRQKEYGYELAVKADICKLLLWIVRRWHKEGLHKLPGKTYLSQHYDNLDKALTYLSIHFRERITVQEMAKLCCMSESYFMTFFKAAMGKTFIHYLNFIRLTEAEKLLLSPEFTITEAALQSGFNDPSYFVRVFRKLKGMRPKEFRAMLLKQ
ncbi:AraC family transcriptional regulator [Paenibacillus gansuensis]|uniref:AraC family transcriptional regulator n=1 Tax=Paenibacillus gansuensis TaxID=306542 RepID=A0ABW5PCN9_9BACL